MNFDPPPPPLTPARRRGWWIHLFLLSAYDLYLGFIGLRGHERLPAAAPAHPVGGLLFDVVWLLMTAGVVFGLALAASRATRGELLLRWHGRVKPLWQGICYSVALRLGSAMLVELVLILFIMTGMMDSFQMLGLGAAHHAGVSQAVSAPAMQFSPAYFWLSLTVTCFFQAGFCEELWRSGMLAALKALWPQYFSSRIGQVGAVALAAVLFGFAHSYQGPLGILQGFIMGFGFGLIMVFHRSIWPAVIAHGLLDATTMFILSNGK